MEPDETPKRRRSLRLKGYDYSSPGAYFITVCTKGRLCLLERAEVKVMVEATWAELPYRVPEVRTDDFVVMPNHVHGIVIIGGNVGDEIDPVPTQNVGAGPCACPSYGKGAHGGASLPDVVHWFKSMTTTRYRAGVYRMNWPPFPGRVWQRNYYEHVIRSEVELDEVREYIRYNPLRWEFDQENPSALGNSKPSGPVKRD